MWGKFWLKEKLLIMRNFSFCQNVFKCCLLQMCQNLSASGKGLIDKLIKRIWDNSSNKSNDFKLTYLPESLSVMDLEEMHFSQLAY